MKQRFYIAATIAAIFIGQSSQVIAADYIAAGKLISGNWHIVTMNTDGTNEQILTLGAYDNHTVVPSPNGSELVFMSARSGQQQVYIMNRDGTNVRQITFNGSNIAPSWSPSGSKIVFAHIPVGSSSEFADIATINTDGTGFVNLTNTIGVHETGPEFRFDGQKIAFSRGNDGTGAIWTMDPSGANQTQITFDGWDEWDPTWSPDGTRVAYHGLSGSDWDVKSVLSTGGGAINYTPWAGSQEQGPFYMRDGQILFTGTSLGVGICRLNPSTNNTVVIRLGTYTAPTMGYVAINPTLVAASAYSVINGFSFGGSLASLLNSDDNKVFILCDEFENIGEIQFNSTLPDGTANQLKFKFEGSASRNDLSQFVRMFNYATNAYVNVSMQNSTLIDSIVEGTISSSVSNYYSLTRQVKSRVFWIPQADVDAVDGWIQSCDQVLWTMN